MSTSESFRAATEAALQQAISDFRALIDPSTSSSHSTWKPVPQSDLSALQLSRSNKADQQVHNGIGQLSDVTVHRKHVKGAPDVVRSSAELSVTEDADIRDLRAVLQTAEVRVAWDRLVERASVLEVLDPSTAISKLDFKLGWPASPRDCILISRVFTDDINTLIYIGTSLPRSVAEYEPAFLRPNPPYVRSHVHLFAWCVHLPLQRPGKARITLFQQWNLKGAILSSTPLELTSLLTGFVDYARAFGDTLPLLSGFGNYFALASTSYRAADEALVYEYAILPNETGSDEAEEQAECSLAQLEARRERSRLERSAELLLPAAHGWDIQVKCQPPSTVADDWTAVAERSTLFRGSRILFRITHAAPSDVNSLVKVTLAFRRLAGGKSLRLNRQLLNVDAVDDRMPTAQRNRRASQQQKHDTFLEDTATLAAPSFSQSFASGDAASGSAASSAAVTSNGTPSDPKSQAVSAQIRRSYTYFASLLQEPEAKWRHVSETRGVSVGQLDSPDRTVTIYRAIATFVGVGVWDLCSSVLTPGARKVWDKSIEDVQTIEEFSELSALCYLKSKAVWPAWPRDSVLIRTVYKSPTSIHIFSFSTEETDLFPSIPPVDPSTIRCNTVIQGWCIEALSPSTTQVTLIEQTNLRGWQTKGLVHQAMVNAVASVGDFTIKSGSPPFINRLLGAQPSSSNYNHEKHSLKVEYAAKPDASSISINEGASAAKEISPRQTASPAFIECEVRCDTDTWGTSLDIVVDPPPSRIACLARHRLAAGGGTWITLEHEVSLVSQDVIAVIVRKGPPSRNKGSVFVNGARVKVDSQAMAEAEIKSLTLERRMRSSPVPLDQWPNLSRPPSTAASLERERGPASKSNKPSSLAISTEPELGQKPAPEDTSKEPHASTVIRDASPTQQPQAHPLTSPDSPYSMQYALEALSLLQALHVEQGPEVSPIAPGWTSFAERGGMSRKKMFPSLFAANPIVRGDKIVEGVTAEQLLSVLTNPSMRPTWDERVENASTLQSFGNGCTSSLITTKPAFLTLKGRLLHVAHVLAQVTIPSASTTSSTSTVYLLASASCPIPEDRFSMPQVNPQALPIGRVLFEGWILETLDPYSSALLPIPSTRTSHFSCIEWGGSAPTSLSSLLNASPVKMIDSLVGQAKKRNIARPLTPPDFCQVEGPLSNDEEGLCTWKLQAPSSLVHEGSFVHCDFFPQQNKYRLDVLLPRLEPTPVPSEAPKSHSRTPSLPFSKRSSQQPGLSTSAPTPSLKSKASSRSLAEGVTPPAQSLRSKPSATTLREDFTTSHVQTSAAKPTEFATRNTADLVIAELLVSYQDFETGGYEVNVMSSSGAAVNASDPIPAFDEITTMDSRDLPFRVSVHEMPEHAVASTAEKPSKMLHLVRATLPTAQFTNPVADPLRDAAGRAPPAWFQRLQRDPRVLVALTVTSLPSEDQEQKTEQSAATPVRVLFNGSRVHVASEKDSKAVFERHSKEDWRAAAAVISRPLGPSRAGDVSSPALPEVLLQPFAVNKRFSKGSEGLEDEGNITSPLSGSLGPVSPKETPEQTEDAVGMVLPKETMTIQQQFREKSASLLDTYPLSLASNAFNPQSTTQRTFSLQFVIIVAVIAFLLGSFLRALLTPADFVLYASHGDKLASATDVALLSAFESRRWRAARRLFEFKLPGRDLIVATVRKN